MALFSLKRKNTKRFNIYYYFDSCTLKSQVVAINNGKLKNSIMNLTRSLQMGHWANSEDQM